MQRRRSAGREWHRHVSRNYQRRREYSDDQRDRRRRQHGVAIRRRHVRARPQANRGPRRLHVGDRGPAGAVRRHAIERPGPRRAHVFLGLRRRLDRQRSIALAYVSDSRGVRHRPDGRRRQRQFRHGETAPGCRRGFAWSWPRDDHRPRVQRRRRPPDRRCDSGSLSPSAAAAPSCRRKPAPMRSVDSGCRRPSAARVFTFPRMVSPRSIVSSTSPTASVPILSMRG